MAGVGLALAGLGALAKLGTGVAQGIKANRIDKKNIRPEQVVNDEYFKNVSDAESMARTGMPSAQYGQAIQNQQRNMNGVVSALSRSANPSAGLASLLRANNDATLNLDVNNANQRIQNRRYLANQRGVLAQQKQNAFDWNYKSKYLADFAKAQALRGSGMQNMMGAFGDVQQLGMMVENPDSANSKPQNQLPSNSYGNYGLNTYFAPQNQLQL